ncbi:MAG TPA: D-2-hydroxyacid dehydrogenase [Candidatus Dormibacteraeota bacterium]|nr:D-2-hydroxyacid dehydrogenase [Candidatus Dormibacteraeota bacterium]
MSAAAISAVRCLVVGQFPPPDLELIRRAIPADRAELVLAEPAEDLARLGKFEVIWRLFPAETDGVARDQLSEALDTHPEVRWVHTASAGIDQLATLLVDRPNTILTHSAGVTAIPIAEFVVGCLLHHFKRVPELAQLQQRRQSVQLTLRELGDLRVVLFGLGAIGSEVARRLFPFGCQLVGVRRDPSRPSPAGVTEVFGPQELARACHGADALVLVAPLTSDTERAVDAGVLSQLAERSVVVNVARGGLVDESALLAALALGRPGAAYLDTFVEEPLPQESPFWTAPGAHVSPHLSWSSSHLGLRTSQLFTEQLSRWLAREPLLNLADPRAGY